MSPDMLKHWIYKLLACSGMDEKNRYLSVTQYFFRGVTKHPTPQARPSMSRHNYHVGAYLIACIDYFSGRIETRCDYSGLL